VKGIDRAATIAVSALLAVAAASAQTLRLASLAQGETRRTAPLARDQARVTFEQASHVLEAMQSSLPEAFRERSLQQIARLWPQWIEQHDRDVRARLERGDEDSLVNFWLYGTSFTSRPPALVGAAAPPGSFDDIVAGRLEDLLDRVTTPGDDERLQFTGRTLVARNADPASVGGRDRARRFLRDARQRMIREFADAERTVAAARPGGGGALAAANATLFRDRGLSSDTSILSDYGVHVALEAIAHQRTLSPGSVRRVAIVGPGLDFTNKTDGYDYYPQQTIQPFALVDALRRVGLAGADLQVTTFDINTRVNDHLQNAAARAASPSGYVVTLPLDGREVWTDSVLAYWRQWGNAIGNEVTATPPPAAAGLVKARAVRIHSAVVSSIVPRDLNVVVDRLTGERERFDLIVATNVLLYYDVFEQALAAANVAAMLRPGGLFVTNTAIFPTSPLRPAATYQRVSHTASRYDEVFWYRRE
jgi:hypothetical protein